MRIQKTSLTPLCWEANPGGSKQFSKKKKRVEEKELTINVTNSANWHNYNYIGIYITYITTG